MKIPALLPCLTVSFSVLAAPTESVVVPPPPSAVYVLVHKYIQPPEAGNETVPGEASQPVVDPALKAFLPIGENADVAREVEYVIAGTTASITVREGGRPVSVQYYAGRYAITQPTDGGKPRITRMRGEGIDEANHFRVAYPYTMVFKPEHFKGRVQLEGKPAMLYEIPDKDRAALSDKVNKPAVMENEEEREMLDESGPSSVIYTELEARRLWVEEGTRRPLLVETDDEAIRYLHKGAGPPKVSIPADCLAALKHYIDLTRVRRAKPY